MQLFTKKSLILFMSVLLSFVFVGCKNDTTTTTTTATFSGETPEISQPDAVFYDGGTYKITYGDIYEEFKVNDGINRLLFMVDSVLLSEYVANVTQEEIDNKIKYLKYGSSDDEAIAKMDEESKSALEDSFAQNIFLLGYADKEDAYARMVVAKENYAKAQMVDDSNANETWYNGPSTIATYYENKYFEDLTSIKIRFYSLTDAKNVLKSFNLVSYNGELRKYTGTKPIDEVPTSSFDDTNTASLTQSELISYFIQMYNFSYSYKDEIPTNSTVEDLIANDELQVNYEDLTSLNSNLATFMFNTLGAMNQFNDESNTKLYYTYQPAKYYGTNDTSYYMILNINLPEKVDVSDFDGDASDLVALIGQDTYDDISQRIETTNLSTSGFVAARVASLRSDNDFVIYDYYLGIDYQSVDVTYELNEEGSKTLVASYTGHEITADDLFTNAMNINGPLYALYAAQMAIVIDQYYNTVYCSLSVDDSDTCEYDFTKNTSTKMEEHRASLKEMQTSFESSYYTYYYTFAEYIYLAYGAKSNDDLLGKYFVKTTLQPYLVYAEIQKDDWALLTDYLYNYVEEYYENYFSLNVDHLLIYVDRDEDGKQDNYPEFLASLEDVSAYETLLGEFESAIRNYLGLSSDNTFATLIDVYSKASRTDATWGVYKNYGFYLLTEDLSSDESLTYLSTVDTYEASFVDGLIETYAQYNLPANIDKTSIYYDGDVVTDYGVHLIYAEKGTDFTKPSAKFEMTYDTKGNPNYSLEMVNDSDELSIDQLKQYIRYRFYEIVYGTGDDVEETYHFTFPKIPTSVMNALEAYYSNLNDSLYVVGYLNIIVSQDLQNGTFTNTVASYCDLTNAQIKEKLLAIKTIYQDQVFPDLGTDK